MRRLLASLCLRGRLTRIVPCAALVCGSLLTASSSALGVMAIDGQGRIVTLRSPERSNFVLRLTDEGDRDRTLDGNGYRRIGRALRVVYDVERLTDGRIVAVGRPRNGDGVMALRVAVLRRDGGFRLSQTIARGRYGAAYLTALADGGLLVAGTTLRDCVDTSGHTFQAHIIRLREDLTRARSFGGGDGVTTVGNDSCQGFFRWATYYTSPAAVAGDGRIVAGGPSFLARFEPDGDPDPTFGGGDGITNDAQAGALAVQPDGSIATAIITQEGPFNEEDLQIRHYLEDGSPDPTFGESGGMTSIPLGGMAETPRIILDGDRLLAAGAATTCIVLQIDAMFGCESTLTLVRLEPSGVRDSGFGDGDGVARRAVNEAFYGSVDLLDTGEDRLVEVGGDPHLGGAAFRASIVFRFRPDGGSDASFGNNGVYHPPRFPSICGGVGPAGFRQIVEGTVEDDPSPERNHWASTYFHGMTGDDTIRAERASGNRYCGGPGNDSFFVTDPQRRNPQSGGKQHAFGQSGRDIISLSFGADLLSGGPGPDRLVGGGDEDVLYGGTGPDRLFTRDGERDLVHCDRGRDVAVVDRSDRLFACERVIRPPRRR